MKKRMDASADENSDTPALTKFDMKEIEKVLGEFKDSG
jgi:hypothetical protein